MSEINLPPFYIGQKVVCITKDYGVDGLAIKLAKEYLRLEIITIKNGETLTVRKCYGECVFFEEKVNKPSKLFPKSDNNELSYDVKYFAPVEEKFESISLTKIIEEETKLVCVN